MPLLEVTDRCAGGTFHQLHPVLQLPPADCRSISLAGAATVPRQSDLGGFRVGCAIAVAQIVWRATRVPLRTALAFCAVWLAPTVLFNGAMWAQADSIWAFFTLVSVALFMRDRNGVLPFAAAVSVKAQGVLLGPLVLGMLLRRRIHPAWLAAVPGIYVVLAIPVLVVGRSLASVAGVYLEQAHTFHRLTMNAANIWVFAGSTPYEIGVAIGLVLAAVSGLGLSMFIARSRRTQPEFILLAACVSLMLMPYLLPKMHERYFYAFELASNALACINPRYLPFAVIAQVGGVLSYLGFQTGIIIVLRRRRSATPFSCSTSYLIFGAANVDPIFRGLPGLASPCRLEKLSYLVLAGSAWNMSSAYLLATGLATAMTVRLLKESRSDLADGPDQLPCNPGRPRRHRSLHLSNMMTLRTVLPAFMAAKPSLISDSFSFAEIQSSRCSLPRR